MGDTNIGAVNFGSGNVTAEGNAVGRNAIAFNGKMPITSAEFVAEVGALRKKLQQEAEGGQPDVAVDDAIAALAWLRQHHAARTRPADADQRVAALKRLRKVWTPLVEMAKQLPAGVMAGWIVEALK